MTARKNKLGVLSKVQPSGPFAEEWRKTLDAIGKDVESVDMALGISAGAMAVKDEKELVSSLNRFQLTCEKLIGLPASNPGSCSSVQRHPAKILR